MTEDQIEEKIDKSFRHFKEGSIINTKISDIKNQVVIVDLGYKSEGVLPKSEFDDDDYSVGDELEVLLQRLEDDNGSVVISKEKAAHKQNWDKILQVYNDNGLIKGKVKSVVKGGLIVNVGAEAFLPGSQIDIIPPKNLNEYVNKVYEFKIIKINDDRKNIVLSRREVIESERAEQRKKFLEKVKVGDKVTGVVKNITDFGAFVDLDGMDGLLHITDLSWGRVNYPTEVVSLGQEIEVVITEIDAEKGRVSLGLKQLQSNPWEGIEEKYPIGAKVKGKVTKIWPYGAFIELEPNVEGLIHVSELSWTKRITRPNDILSVDQEVEAIVLGISKEEQKISLGYRQLEPNPWDNIKDLYPINSKVRGTIRNLTNYGAFVELQDGIDGMIHVTDLSWTRKINHPSEMLKKDMDIEAIVIDIDKNNKRISLSIKALEPDPWSTINDRFKVGDLVKGKVVKIASFGAFVQLDDDIDGLVHISQISEDHVSKIKDVLQVGEEVEARVIKIDSTERRIGLSIKAKNYDEKQLKRETKAFEALNTSVDMVGLDEAFRVAQAEEYRPGEGKKSDTEEEEKNEADSNEEKTKEPSNKKEEKTEEPNS